MARLLPYICFVVLILLMRVEGEAGRLAHDEGEGLYLLFIYTHAVSGFQIIF
jgi:hypothetical protein